METGNEEMQTTEYQTYREDQCHAFAQPALYSPTGEKHGSGSDRYRWVSYLTPVERDLVREGRLVVIDHGDIGTTHGLPPVRMVIYSSGRFDSRIPPADRLAECLVVAGYENGN